MFKKAGFIQSVKERVLFYLLNARDKSMQVSQQAKANAPCLLVVKLDLLGDYILIRNHIESIKKSPKFQNHKIVFCCNKGIEELSRSLDAEFIDEWISLQLKPFIKDPAYRKGVLEQLLSHQFDLAIFPTHSRSFFYDDMIAKLVRANRVIGSSGNSYNQLPWQHKKGKKYFDKLIKVPERHVTELELNQTFFGKLLEDNHPGLFPTITTSTKPEKYRILFSPGASAEFRRWSTQNFITMAFAILNQVEDCEIVISGSPGEKALGQEIKDAFLNDSRVIDQCGSLKLSELVDVLATCHLVVSNESGTVHLARAVGVRRIFCISNGNHYGRFNPYPEQKDGPGVEYFYPKEVLDIIAGKHQSISKDDLYWGSRINIDGVGTEQVISRLMELKNNIFQTV